ncbi:ATP-dependent helicase [Treponema pedis]|uniref:ATP-dependent helicase n=1 Tax=Treponema pedis TaxID=409322 RepID=UPI003B969C3E
MRRRVLDKLNYLEILNKEQLEAVKHLGAPLLILAGAGSGKTRVITTKIAWLIAECGILPEQILAVTFTNKAAREMLERAEALEPAAGRSLIRTFHSFGAWILRRYSEAAGLSPNFTIYDDEDACSLLSQAMPGLSKNQVRGIIKKISRAKDYCLLPDNPLLHEVDTNPQFAEAYQRYQERLKETGNADFGDLIMLPVKLLKEIPQIRASLQNRFSVIMVDEYQDSNIAQFEFLKQLAGEHTYVCVVGDDDQSIYRFRGAEVQNILTFADNFKNTKIIRLEKNYRSYSEILSVADSVVKKNSGRLGKTLYAERGSGEKPEIYFLPNQEAEAELCGQLILQDIKKGGRYSDWAILYRTNAQSLNFETDFLHKKIPYKVIGTLKFYEREEIKDTLAVLALIANGRDEIALRRIINKPARGIGGITQTKLIEAARSLMFGKNGDIPGLEPKEDFISALTKSMERITLTKKAKTGLTEFLAAVEYLRKVIETGDINFNSKEDAYSKKGEGLAPFIYEILRRTGLAEHYESEDAASGTQKTANLNELANAASLYDFSVTGLTEFLEHIELDRSLAETDDNIDSVNLITIHNTKGLEFKNVIITGLETGVFPRDNGDFDELEEERRLMYVACTRAKDMLYMTTCSSRRLYGSLSFMQPSRFIFEIEKSLVKFLGMSSSFFNGLYGNNGNYNDYNDEDEKNEYAYGQELNANPYKKKTYSLKENPYGKQIDISSIKKPKNVNPLNGKWKKGVRIYHDEYGYGGIIKAEETEGELVISVKFETGFEKRFMPAYQSGELTVIK